jgi:hypothetical protein
MLAYPQLQLLSLQELGPNSHTWCKAGHSVINAAAILSVRGILA